ncbi:MAG TPA: DUF6328 family protein [Nitrososphaeraceae archaeon]|jgi:hypothetical protein
MSSESDGDRVVRHSSEHYDPVGSDLDWFIILASASSIFFGFLLKIAVSPPSYFTFFDDTILLTALYALAISTAMFVLPIIYHVSNYRRLDVERFLARTRRYALAGFICVMLAMYLVLGLLLNSKLPIQLAYTLPSLPFVYIVIRFIRHIHE